MIKLVQGNILDSKDDIICQQVNCQSKMSVGLALQIRKEYPQVQKEYKSFCSKYSPEELLGKIQFVEIGYRKYICNIFGQLNYGRDKIQTDYKALEKAFTKLNTCSGTIAIPYGLGCGLAGGDWNIVYGIIEDTLKNKDVTIYKLK